MRTQPIRRVVGAVGASLLVVAAVACSSDSDEPSAESDTTAPAATTDGSTAEATAPATQPTTQDGESAPTSATQSTDAATTVVPEALRFTAPLVGGGTFDGAATAGTPTVFWFWAPT